AALEITELPLGIDERQLFGMIWLQDYGQVTPVIEGEVTWTPAAAATAQPPEVLKVLGIDILTDLAFRDYAFTEQVKSQETSRDLLSLLSETNAVVLTASFARAHGLRVGDDVQFGMADRAQSFHIRGLLRDEGPARAMGGSVIVMDIAAAQVALN